MEDDGLVWSGSNRGRTLTPNSYLNSKHIECNILGYVMNSVVAKMRFQAIRTFVSDGKKCASLEFTVVGGTTEENKKFFEWTPCGKMDLSTVNQAVIEALDLNSDYYVIVTKEKPEGL